MRTQTIAAACVAALMLVSAAEAHICMWSPRQRGAVDISGPAEDPCYRKVGPCGTNTMGTVTTMTAGQLYTVEFQQNANHYYTGNPGSLVVDWAKGSNPSESDFTTLVEIGDYNAMGELTQTNFSRTINIPNVACDACVLRARYVSNNPLEDPQGHGPTFYQCADVKFVASDATPAPAVATPAPVATETTDKSCCAPATFTTSFTMDKPMTQSKGVIYYDADNKMMREDVVHGDGTGTTATNGRFTIISNFTSGDGYYLNVVTGKCMLGGAFGLDLWNNWCFGSASPNNENEKFGYSAPCTTAANGMCDFYFDGEWTFGATSSMCFPDSIVGVNNSGNHGTVNYFGAKVGPISSSMWVTPPACLAAANARRAQATTQVEGAEGSLTQFLTHARR